jgi:hypothetical protein
MTDSITPPPELVQQWVDGAYLSNVHHNEEDLAYEQYIAARAAQWGADQELEACCKWVAVESIAAATELRAARRFKQPSLKEEALTALTRYATGKTILTNNSVDIIRRALEQLDD